MDFIHYAKWGIHVKEEPDSLDITQLKEADDSNVAEINGGWMCKFPCDAQAAFNVSIADSIPSGLQEPIEASLPSYSVDYPESLDIHPSEVSTIPGVPEESVNVDRVTQLYSMFHEDEAAKKNNELHENIEENDFIKSPPRFQSLANIHAIDEIQQLASNKDAAVLHDIPQRELISTSFENIGRNVVSLAKDVRLIKSNEVSVNDDSPPGELLQNWHSELIDKAFSAIDSIENTENQGTPHTRPNDSNHLQNGICTWTKSDKMGTKNCLKEKSPKKMDHSGFKCPDCDKVLRRSSGFLTHMKLHHMNFLHSEPDTVKCKHCSEVFQNRKSLSRHKKACKYSKKNSIGSFCEKDSQVLFSTRCSDEGVHESSFLKTLLEDAKNESSSSRRDKQDKAESHLHPTVDSNQKNPEKPRRSRSSGSNSSKKTSSKEKFEQSQNLKRRRLSQSFTDLCSENVGSEGMEKNGGNVQDKESGVKNIDYQESWFSELKCKEDEKRQASKSIILSLRRFRFRRPKVLVKRSEILMCAEKGSETKSVDSQIEDACSSNVTITPSDFHEDNIVHNSLNESTSKNLTTELGTMNECHKETGSNLEFTRDLDTLMLPVNHESLQANSHFVISNKSLDMEKYNLKLNTSDNLNKQSPNILDMEKNLSLSPTESQNVRYSSPGSVASNSSVVKSDEKDSVVDALHDSENKHLLKFSKEPKAHSNLKIRIKPVVVLNRLGLLDSVNRESRISAIRNSKKPFQKTQTYKKNIDQTTTNVDSRESNNGNMQGFQAPYPQIKPNFEIPLSSDLGSTDQTAFGYELASHTQNLDCGHDSLEVKNKHCSKNMRDSFAKKSITHNSICSFDKSKSKGQKDDGVSFETLEKQYGLKKCFVKLTRICIEDNDVEKYDKNFNENTKTGSELRTCEKLKLHRTNSKSWEVSSVKSHHLQSFIPVDKTPHVDLKDLTKENVSKKKYCQTPEASSHDSCESSSGMSRKSLNIASKGRNLKPFRTRCTWCQKPFFNQQEFAEHIRTHFEGYKCPNCSAKFHFWMELQTHLAGCSLVSLLNCQNNSPIKNCKVIL